MCCANPLVGAGREVCPMEGPLGPLLCPAEVENLFSCPLPFCTPLCVALPFPACPGAGLLRASSGQCLWVQMQARARGTGEDGAGAGAACSLPAPARNSPVAWLTPVPILFLGTQGKKAQPATVCGYFPGTEKQTPAQRQLIREPLCSDLWVGWQPGRWHCLRSARTGPPYGLWDRRGLCPGQLAVRVLLRVLGATSTELWPADPEAEGVTSCPSTGHWTVLPLVPSLQMLLITT